MAGAEDGEATEAFSVATWRIVTLFLLILLVDTAVELVDEMVTHHLRRNPESAHAWSQLKFETMALGVVSLLLVVFEEHLLKICIDSPEKDKYGDYPSYAEDAYAPDKAAAGLEAGDHHRRLLGGGGGNQCSEGKESVWGTDLIHKAHILIFLIAACHIIWAILSSVMSMVALRRWNKFEAHIHDRGLLNMPVGGLQRHGEPTFVYGLRQCIRQFTHPVDEAQFGAIRALFIEFTKSEENFDFAGFVSKLLTAEFASVVKIDIFMWGLVCVWVSFPEGSYGGLWLTGAFVVVSIIAGAKLHTVAMHLSRHAYSRFYRPLSHKPLQQKFSSISDNTKDALEAGAKAAAGPVAEGMDQDDEPVEVAGSEMNVSEVPSKRVALRRMIRGHSQRIKGADKDADLQGLFWFQKPRHMLRVFRYAFFQSGLGVAAIIFRFWQDEGNFLGGAISNHGTAVRVVAWLFLLMVLMLLWHISVYILPVYALTAATVMFSKVENVLEYAKRNNIRPELVDFLERTAARKGDDEDSDDEDFVHVVSNCNNETCTATEPAGEQQEVAGVDTKPTGAQLSERAGSLLAKEGSASDGVSAPVSSSSPSQTAAVAVGTVSGKPSSENERGLRPGLAVRAAAEMPTSGGDGGGEVDWFDQMEREQGELMGPAVDPNYTDEPASKRESTVRDTPQGADTPAKAAEAAPEAAPQGDGVSQSTEPPRVNSSGTALALAASEMPVSGLQGDAAVDWLDRLEREQGDLNSSGRPPVRHGPSAFMHVARSSNFAPTGHHLGSNRGMSGVKSFASVMLAPRVTADMESSECQMPKIHSGGHSGGQEPGQGSNHSKHAHDHPEARPPTIADVVSGLLESMASKRRAELTRRLQIRRAM